MDKRSTLHWSAVMLALFAASWMLLSFVGGLVFLMPLFAIAGFILALVASKALLEEDRSVVRSGAVLGLAVYGLWILLALASMPVSIKNVGTHTPPLFFSELADALATILAALGAVAVLLTFWRIWHRREQVVGGIGTALVVLIQVIVLVGAAPAGDSVGTLFEFGFALGFLLLAVATVMPLLRPEGTHAAWRHGATSE